MKKQKNSRAVFIILGILVIAIGGGIYLYVKNKNSSKIVYREVTLKRGPIELKVLSTGSVAPENRLDIKPPIAGRIEQVLIKEGQVVRKGQMLAWMSSTERAALLDAARSRGVEEVARWEELYRPTPVLAPINGTIIQRNVESGQTFSNTDAIFTMADRLTVKAQVDETDIALIKLNQPSNIELDAYPGKGIRGIVDQIAFDAKVVNSVTSYVVDSLPIDTPAYMRSGMTANVTFIVEHKDDALLAPADTIRTVSGHSVLLMRGSDGQAADRDVKIGINDGKQVEILAGAEEGDVVLIQQAAVREKKASGGSNPFGPQGPPRPNSGGRH